MRLSQRKRLKALLIMELYIFEILAADYFWSIFHTRTYLHDATFENCSNIDYTGREMSLS